MTDLVLVFTTMPDDHRADALARTLVEERLAACVSVHAAMCSHYRWQGQLTSDPERQVVIKTARERLPALEARLRALHPYDLPEFLVLSAESGSAEYLRWVADAVGPA